MNTRDTSLLDLLFPQGHGVSDPVWSKIILNPAVIPVLASFALDIVDGVKTQIRDSVGTLFQMSLLDVLVSGWKKYDEVSQALEKSKQTPNDTVLESMANHTFKSVHHPYIAVYKADIQVGKIEFETTVALNVEGVQLKIKNGEITGILTGSCQGSVKLAFAGQVLSEAQTGRIALPGSVAVTPAAQGANGAVPQPEEPREQVAKVQVAPPPELPEQSVQKQAPQNPLPMKSTGPEPVSNERAHGTPPPPPSQRRSRTSNKAVLLVAIVAVLCICAATALLLLAILRPTSTAQFSPPNPPVLAPVPGLPPPTSAPFLVATLAPTPAVPAAPATTAPVLPPLTAAASPTPAATAPPPTAAAAPATTAPVLPPPTAAPALPPPGLYVTSMGMDQAQPVHGQLVNFTVSFLNTTGGDVNVKWRVYIYRTDTPTKSNTDSAPVQTTLHPGPTLDQPVPMNFKLGSTGNACDNFFVRVDTLDSSNKPTGELAATDGKVFQKDFVVCN